MSSPDLQTNVSLFTNFSRMYTITPPEFLLERLLTSSLCSSNVSKPLTRVSEYLSVHVSVNKTISLEVKIDLSSSDCNLFVSLVTKP